MNDVQSDLFQWRRLHLPLNSMTRDPIGGLKAIAGTWLMTPPLGSTFVRFLILQLPAHFPCVSLDTLGLVMCDPSTAVGKTELATQHPEKNGRISRRLAGSKGTRVFYSFYIAKSPCRMALLIYTLPTCLMDCTVIVCLSICSPH